MLDFKELTKENIMEKQEKYSRYWEFGNNILYNMCAENPMHNKPDLVLGKIWLIGRSYSAAIERRVKGKSLLKQKGEEAEYTAYIGDKFYEEKVWPEIERADIDGWLLPLRDAKITPEALGITIKAHYDLMKVFSRISGMEKRSLASKYLHFHAPNLFFIYDSRAATAISRLRKGGYVGPKYNSFEKDKENCDPEYAHFCHSCLWLQSEIKKHYEIELTPRGIDNLLYAYK